MGLFGKSKALLALEGQLKLVTSMIKRLSDEDESLVIKGQEPVLRHCANGRRTSGKRIRTCKPNSMRAAASWRISMN